MNCPYCKSTDIRLSQHPHQWDLLHRLRGQEAFRCRACRSRFFAPESALVELEPAQRRLKSLRSNQLRKSLLRGVGIFATLLLWFVVYWALLRYFTAERELPQDVPASFLHVPVSGSLPEPAIHQQT